MAVQHESVIYNVQLGKGSVDNERVLAEVGDTVVAILRQDDGSYVQANIILTTVDHPNKTYGWDRTVNPYRSRDVLRFHHKHTMLCS
jgi:hypothetical protein